MSKRAIILANGAIENPSSLRSRLATWGAAQVIAANGGSQHARHLGLQVDVVVGDLDSFEGTGQPQKAVDGPQLKAFPVEKNETDLELALLFAVQSGAKEVAVLGALGGRLDMTIANVLLLTHPQLSSAHVELWHADQTAWILRPPSAGITGRRGDTLSLIPIGGDAVGITTSGLAYPLREETLASGPARGVSNVLTGDTARVDLVAGSLLAIHTPGRA